VIEDGVTGLLSPTAAPADLAACIRTALDYPDRRRRMGEQAAQSAADHYDVHRMIQDFGDLLRRNASRPGSHDG
jgi:glycosyltransferase involved in cell wall biosynthesis